MPPPPSRNRSLLARRRVLQSRFISCRHVLCQSCVEQTVRYFRECPMCYAPLLSEDFRVDPYQDESHARVMRLKVTPPPRDG